MINSTRRLIGTLSVLCTVGAVGLLAPNISDAQANAAGRTPSVGLKSCHPSAVSQPFAPWLDYSFYELAPGGHFERSTWTLTHGAKRVAGGEPFAATGTRGRYSLSVPRAASAQSPLTCVDATYPSIRFFIAGKGSVAVSVIDGRLVVPAGVAVAGRKWAPTPVMLTLSPVLGVLSGGSARVSLRFTGRSGRPRIDDVFIDPWSRG